MSLIFYLYVSGLRLSVSLIYWYLGQENSLGRMFSITGPQVLNARNYPSVIVTTKMSPPISKCLL